MLMPDKPNSKPNQKWFPLRTGLEGKLGGHIPLLVFLLYLCKTISIMSTIYPEYHAILKTRNKKTPGFCFQKKKQEGLEQRHKQ